MLALTGLARTLGSQTIFKDFSLTLAPGGFTVLVGPSGCGKSTLFDCLTGMMPPDQGQITWNGIPVEHLGTHAAYMQQKDMLLPWLTLMENALLPVRAAGPAGGIKIAAPRAGELFNRMGLKGFETYYPAQVSGGMRQRCALVRTLMFDRDLVLLDEPLSALDAITRQALQGLLLMLQKDFNKTVLMITHDIDEALCLGDEICVLSPCPMSIVQIFVPESAKPRDFRSAKFSQMKLEILAWLRDQRVLPWV